MYSPIFNKSVQRESLHTLRSGEVIILDAGSALAPSVGWGDTGFYEVTPNVIYVSLDGTAKWRFTSSFFGSTITAQSALLRETATSNNPNIVPSANDADTGVGWRIADVGVLIAGGVNVLEFGEAGAAPLLGFYGTAAVAKPTGVAVSSAGIHAALVTLGLIAA